MCRTAGCVPTDIPSISKFDDERLRFPQSPATSPNQVIAYWLKRDIIRGVFEPEEKLRIEFLTQFYGAGHSPIREAILFMAAGGLVVHEHQKGHRVAPVSLGDYYDSLDVYDRIRRLALSTAIEKGDDAWEERVILQLHRSKKVPHVLPGDDHEGRERWQRAYGDFYDILISGCSSPLLIQFYSDLMARAERYTNLFADQTSDSLRDHAAEHAQVVDAMIARDTKRLHEILNATNQRAKQMRSSTIEVLKQRQLDAA